MNAEFSQDDIVYSVPHEKWIFRRGQSWEMSTPVKKAGAMAHLVAIGWPPGQAKMFLESPDLQTVVYGADMRPGKLPYYIEEETGRRMLNLWVPPTIRPEAAPFPTISLVLDNVTGGDALARAWLEQWLAVKVQIPEIVPKVAVVLATSQGAGKGFLARVMFAILGESNCAIVKESEISRNFNSRWVRKLFILGDEVISGTSDTMSTVAQLLKIYVDGGELEFEQKYEVQRSTVNRMSWMLASNSKVSPLVLEESDRRYAIFTSFDPVTPAYKAALDACFESDRTTLTPAFREEIAGFAHYLLGLTVDRSAVAKPYDSEARAALIDASKPSHEGFCEYIEEVGPDVLLDRLVTARDFASKYVTLDRKEYVFPNGAVATSALYHCYVVYCREAGQHPLRLNKFGHALINRAGWKQVRMSAGHHRPKGYLVPGKPASGGV